MRVNSTEESVLVPNLHPGVTYSFVVVAVNDIGDSRPSEPETARTLEESKKVDFRWSV